MDSQYKGVLAQLVARDASRQQQIERARESRMDEADPKESVAAFWTSFKTQLEGAGARRLSRKRNRRFHATCEVLARSEVRNEVGLAALPTADEQARNSVLCPGRRGTWAVPVCRGRRMRSCTLNPGMLSTTLCPRRRHVTRDFARSCRLGELFEFVASSSRFLPKYDQRAAQEVHAF
jgi:hypothetical protein